MTLYIHTPPATDAQLLRFDCPTCGKPRWMTVFAYEWYDSLICCLGCGERWTGAEMMPRPFAPQWRERSKAMARASYRRARDLLREGRK